MLIVRWKNLALRSWTIFSNSVCNAFVYLDSRSFNAAFYNAIASAKYVSLCFFFFLSLRTVRIVLIYTFDFFWEATSASPTELESPKLQLLKLELSSLSPSDEEDSSTSSRGSGFYVGSKVNIAARRAICSSSIDIYLSSQGSSAGCWDIYSPCWFFETGMVVWVRAYSIFAKVSRALFRQ